MYQLDIGITALREWRSYGYLWSGAATGGLSALIGDGWLGGVGWHLATMNDAIYNAGLGIGIRMLNLYGYLMNGVIHGGLYFLDGYLYSNWWVATSLPTLVMLLIWILRKVSQYAHGFLMVV